MNKRVLSLLAALVLLSITAAPALASCPVKGVYYNWDAYPGMAGDVATFGSNWYHTFRDYDGTSVLSLEQKFVPTRWCDLCGSYDGDWIDGTFGYDKPNWTWGPNPVDADDAAFYYYDYLQEVAEARGQVLLAPTFYISHFGDVGNEVWLEIFYSILRSYGGEKPYGVAISWEGCDPDQLFADAEDVYHDDATPGTWTEGAGVWLVELHIPKRANWDTYCSGAGNPSSPEAFMQQLFEQAKNHHFAAIATEVRTHLDWPTVEPLVNSSGAYTAMGTYFRTHTPSCS